MNYQAFTNDSLTMMYEAIRGALAADDALKRQGLAIRFRVRETHARRPFCAKADIEENARREAADKKEVVLSPIASEVVHRIDALFEIERSINQ